MRRSEFLLERAQFAAKKGVRKRIRGAMVVEEVGAAGEVESLADGGEVGPVDADADEDEEADEGADEGGIGMLGSSTSTNGTDKEKTDGAGEGQAG